MNYPKLIRKHGKYIDVKFVGFLRSLDVAGFKRVSAIISDCKHRHPAVWRARPYITIKDMVDKRLMAMYLASRDGSIISKSVAEE